MNRRLIPWLILVGTLLLTGGVTGVAYRSERERHLERFENAVQTTEARIEARMRLYAMLLGSGTGFFAASPAPVTREAFHAFAQRLELRAQYPGIQGIGFSRRVRPAERDSLVAALRAQGLAGFRLWPEAEGEVHAIVYLEPLDARNQAALGYDMFSEATRRAAMARAWATGEASLSGRVTLVQEIEGRVQAGFLIYVPVYRGGRVPPTPTAREALLDGFIYAPFRADDLFEGIFSAEENPRVAFAIYDGAVAEENLLHDSVVAGTAPAARPRFTTTTRLALAGRTWTLRFATTEAFEESAGESLVPVVGVAGLFLSLLLFALSREQQRGEAAVRARENRLRAVLEALPVGIVMADPAGRITFANPEGRRIWARDPVGATDFGAGRRWDAEGRPIPAAEGSLARALRGETAPAEVVDVEAYDGTRRTLISAALPLHDARGRLEAVVAALVDITPQRAAEAAERSRAREFRTLADFVPQLVCVAAPDGRPLWYNQRWHDFTGLPPADAEAPADLWQGRLHPEHQAPVLARLRAALAAGRPWEDAFPLQRRDGTYRWFLAQAVPLCDGEAVARWFVTATDVTEQRRAREAEARAIREQAAREAAEAREAQLRRHAAELERSNRELQDFAYVASHDLQEPLRKISSFADLLQSDLADRLDPEGRHYLERMQHAALRMSRLIHDLLAFSRVTTKAQPFAEVDLGALVQEVLSDLEVRLAETGGTVEVGALPAIEADATQMRQLFQNLIGNALKFHREGVPPRVRVGATAHEAANPFDGRPQTFYHVAVADNGIGFDEKYLDRIFIPFQRLHGAGAYEGTGMGLAICRRIVERHGGTIMAESTPGQGSVFTVVLPAEPAG